MYNTKFHRDGTVTVWDVYLQQWTRRGAYDLYANDRTMASLPGRDRLRVEAIAHMRTLSESRALARSIYNAADDGGTIQAGDMLGLTRRADLHTTCSMQRAADALGCRLALDELMDW